MFTYILRRIFISVPTIVIVSMVVFGLQLLLPGDPALALAGEDRDPQVIAYMRQLYHLDQPIYVQYGYWIWGVLQGDLGQSIRLKLAVSELVKAKLPVTLQLAVMAMTIAILIGIPMGIISAVKKGSALDYAANVVGLAGLSVPNFWLGIIMILFFSVELGWLPASGYVSPREDLRQNLSAMIMPAFVLGSAIAAVLMRHTRSAMLVVMRSDYVRTARAKGLREPRVIYRHALRNALIPVVTLGAIQFGQLLGGAVLTEQVFTIPGFGKLIVDAVFNRDYAVVQGVVLCTATGFLFLNLCADLIYFLVNPRMRA
ncbi:MAG: ABC transporter permease [Proteobacteria bacterium]|nr:ABC transporter permease [Pseudomonadota bacterium]MBI3495732.1 ABC transporter permease [Pseudomonadota bacterium]